MDHEIISRKNYYLLRKVRRYTTWIGISFITFYFISPTLKAQEQGQVSDFEELAALTSLYNQTNGTDWQNNLNWLEDVNQDDQINALDFQFWFGLTVEEGDVVSINLNKNGLSGEIPPNIDKLEQLVSINLSTNEISGEIPNQLVNLVNLKTLNLATNSLQGNIPSAFAQSLNEFNIANNQFTFVDLEPFFTLPILISNFTYIPQKEIDEAQTIFANPGDTLALVSSIPSTGNTFARWQKLEQGEFINQFRSSGGQLIFTDFTRADTGCYRVMATNLLVPGLELFQAPVKVRLDTSTRLFDEGQVADSLELEALIAFYNSTNGPNWQNSEGWLEDINQDGFLNYLDFEEWRGVQTQAGDVVNLSFSGATGLDGFIPPQIGGLSQLRHFFCQFENLSGSLPAEMTQLTNLESLTIQNAPLEGEIPAGIENLTKLEAFIIEDTEISGSIPSEIGNLNTLRRLVINRCNIQGSIPSEIGNLENLQVLILNNDSITGEIPTEIGNLSKLITLSISGNQISGEIPLEIGQLTQLTSFSLVQTKVSGQIPLEIGQLNRLVALNLSDNHLSGSIPAQLGELNDLRLLNLSKNQLSGNIPSDLGQLRNLNSLDLSGNFLNGNIPQELSQILELFSLFLQNNQLSGNIPPDLGQLSQLSSLNISDNELSGNIPPELGQLSSIVFLEMEGNQLTGSIPEEFTQLTRAFLLDFSRNNLQGSLPPALSSLQVNLEIDFNAYDFIDLAPILKIPRNIIISYIPQQEIGLPQTILFVSGDTLTLQGEIEGNLNTTNYQWERWENDTFVAIPGETNLNLTLNQVTEASQYRLTASSDEVPGLVLFQAPISLELDSMRLVSIEGFVLIDATTDLSLNSFDDGDSIVLNDLVNQNLAIKALSGEKVESIELVLSGPVNQRRVENVAPYSLFGNKGDDFFGVELNSGFYTLRATPFSEDNMRGQAGESKEIDFLVIQKPTVTQFLLVNTQADTIIRPLNAGDTIDLAQEGNNLSVIALTEPSEVGSVLFALNNQARFNIENKAPYALSKNVGNNFFTTTFDLGTNILTASPFMQENAQGEQGISLSIQFELINQESTSEDINLTVFPNSTSGWVNIQSDTQELGEGVLEILDTRGQIIYRENFIQLFQKRIYLPKPGMYIARIVSEKKNWIKRILVK